MKPLYSLQILFFVIALILGEGSGWYGLSVFLLGFALSLFNFGVELYALLGVTE